MLALLVLAGCASPSGVEVAGCGPDFQTATVVVTQPGGVNERPIPIDCMHEIEVRRIRIGFTLPGGPDCIQLTRVELSESADAVAVTLIGAINDDPAAGACPDEGTTAMTEVDLAAQVDDRVLLDGSGAAE